MHMFTAGLQRRLVSVGLLGLVAASLAVALAPFGWPFELFAHFRWQLAAATIVLVPAAVLCGRRQAVALAALALVLQLTPLAWPRLDAPKLAHDCAEAEFRVATVNLWYRNDERARALEWLESTPADVVVLQEVTPEWVAALDATVAEYPHRSTRSRQDPYGLGVLSRWPLESVEYVDFADDGLPSLVATVNVQGRRVQVIGLHTRWPLLKSLQLARDEALRRAAARARTGDLPTVLTGDFNLTPYAPEFDRLERESGLHDAFEGRLWRPTWLAGFWPLALPIDHVLVPAGSCIVDARVGPEVASDHRPVVVALRWH